MTRKKIGRTKGSRNRGYFYRSGRGWYTKEQGRFIPLLYEEGDRIKDPKVDEQIVKEAHARHVLARQKKKEKESTITTLEVCQAYLENAKATGAEKTHHDRADTLFDFCFGLPPEYRSKDGGAVKRLSKEKKQEMAKKRIHKGYGRLPVMELRPLDIDQWLNSHKNWNGGRRSRIQAVKRALNYGKESGLIPKNPIRGYKTPKNRSRCTYIRPKQEEAILGTANWHFRQAVRVCIRTGARPGCEFAIVARRHITDHGNRMEWKFSAKESKTGKRRIIRITEPEIIEIVRTQMKKHRTGPIFRNTKGRPWTEKTLSAAFRACKRRLEKKGMEFDDDCCMYSCRHTYAKRTLEGYWTGKPINIETLARLMGNSPQVCRDYYLDWSVVDSEFLWEAT